MKDFALNALDVIKVAGAQYGDIRILDQRSESIELKNKITEGISSRQSIGYGIRIIKNGSWGFASSSVFTRAALNKAVRLAVKIAKASALAKNKDIRLSSVHPLEANYRTYFVKNPFEVPFAEKIKLLSACCKEMQKERDVKLARGFYHAFETNKIFASTEDVLIDQVIIECGAGIAATAITDGELQVRSYPNSFRGNFATAGFEYVEKLKLLENSARVAREAAELLRAPQCPSGKRDVIIDASQLALQIHESIGHPIELDRVLGMEASFAGTSFLKPTDIGKLRYGSEIVNVVADATVPGGLGTFGYDDEGVPAQKVDIIKNGIFAGFLSSRETAPQLGIQSGGTMRAESWSAIPLIRMTNINLLPGTRELDELIADTDGGLFLETNRSWSIDDKRLNFQFGTEIAYEIQGGRLGRIFKNPTYTGITPAFWGSCDAICNEKYWKMWGTPNCGKGEPMQTAHVGHGASPARFRNAEVGVMK